MRGGEAVLADGVEGSRGVLVRGMVVTGGGDRGRQLPTVSSHFTNNSNHVQLSSNHLAPHSSTPNPREPNPRITKKNLSDLFVPHLNDQQFINSCGQLLVDIVHF